METRLKENNGGGLSIEHYDAHYNIISVVTGLEYNPKNQLNDLISYGEDWDWSDVGGQINGYNEDGNLDGDCDEDGKEYTASDMVDNHETTKTIAIWDGKELTLYINQMGRAGQDFFGLERP